MKLPKFKDENATHVVDCFFFGFLTIVAIPIEILTRNYEVALWMCGMVLFAYFLRLNRNMLDDIFKLCDSQQETMGRMMATMRGMASELSNKKSK